MKIVKCTVCGKPFAYEELTDTSDFGYTVQCPHCDHRDYAYTFDPDGTKKQGRSDNGAQGSIADEITELALDTELIEMTTPIENFANAHEMDEESVVLLLNLFLKSESMNGVDFNPELFVRLLPGEISADKVMAKVEEALKKEENAKAPKQEQEAQQHTPDQQYDELFKQFMAVKKENSELFERLRELEAECKKLKDEFEGDGEWQ